VQGVAGSSPATPTNEKRPVFAGLFFFDDVCWQNFNA